MTIREFQSIVLRLSNQTFVRHYLYLNYPNDPQIMGIQFQANISPRRYERERSCECGTCKKCIHREAMRTKYRVQAADGSNALAAELTRLGFGWRDDLKLWAVERTEPRA